MIQAIHTAAAGLSAQQTNIDTIGNNIANISTTSFKSSRVSFADALYEQMKKPLEAGDYLQQGNGSLPFAIRLNTQGIPVSTGSALDFMLSGGGYFAVAGPQGELYTRDGSFAAAAYGGSTYLVTAEGYPVLNAQNQAVEITGDISQLSVDGEGNVRVGNAPMGRLKIVEFTNPEGLLSEGNSKFAATEASGAAGAAADTTVRQGALEGSNVNLAVELTRLMRAQRAFAVLGSAIRTADEMEQLSNAVSK